MNLEHFRVILLEKQRECLSGLAALEAEARGAGKREVRDSMDEATVSQGTPEALEEGTIERVEARR